ncbi:MAG: fluoride efflux transporter CrcB [Gemmatimonadales bacterium]
MPRPAEMIASVAIGGAAGSVARYFLSGMLQGRSETLFPVGTMVVNVCGCLAIGFLMRLVLDTGEFSPTVRALLTTGFLGGFTTFSTFAWETMSAVEEGAWRRAIGYAGGSVVLGLGAVWLGSVAAQLLLRAIRGEAG